MKELILLLGSNINDKKNNLIVALNKLSEVFGNIKKNSHIYETEPWGYKDDNTYYNLAVVFETDLSPLEALYACKGIEIFMGRRKKTENKYESRIIDIDIITYGDTIYNNGILNIPHMKIQDRRFVLEPLCEIVPNTIHPVYKLSFQELLDKCTDNLRVKKLIGSNNIDLPSSSKNLNNSKNKNNFIDHDIDNAEKITLHQIDYKNNIPYNYIAIEGCIGAGKTSLAQLISKNINAKLILEQFEDNNFLPKFYKNPDKYAFPLELSFLASRYNQLNKHLRSFDLFKNGIVADYFLAKSYIFSRRTLQKDLQNLYFQLFSILENKIMSPDIILYLYMDVDRLLYQIKKRGRPYEQDISGDYLQSIQESYLDYFETVSNKRVLIVDVNNLDFVSNTNDYKKLFNLLQDNWDNKIYKLI
jgi:deoxyguanosine kinase